MPAYQPTIMLDAPVASLFCVRSVPLCYTPTRTFPALSTNPKPTIPGARLETHRIVPAASSATHGQTGGGRSPWRGDSNCETVSGQKGDGKRRVFFLDVNPLCYRGSTRSLHSFAHWISLFFSQVSLRDPVIAVFDGEGGNDYRRRLLPSYKAHRRKFSSSLSSSQGWSSKGPAGRSHSHHQLILDVLKQCHVPFLKVDGHEADDVVATLVGPVLQRGHRVVIASPDKDFKQLISEDVQIVMPMPELKRWSFYTLKHYRAQYNCDPHSDLSLRCIMGDEVDGVPGIQHFVPGFGRKTAVKLVRKHGSLENLLSAAAVRTVGKPYAQDTLVKYADYLRRNYEILSLRRDIDIHLQEEWLSERDTCRDFDILTKLFTLLGDTHKLGQQSGSHPQKH